MTNLALLALFTGILQFRTEVRDFFSMDAKTSSAPYFNALVASSTNADYITRKMKNLPGVKSVEVKASEKIKSEVGGLLRELGSDLEEAAALMGSQYSSFKIVLDKGTRPESRKLIKEYFSRLTGKEEVTFSQVKKPKAPRLNTHPLYGIFAKWSDWYLASIAALGWFFTLCLLAAPMRSQGYVIEKFQRKEKTALKMFGWLWLAPVVSFTIAAFALDLRVGILDFAPSLILLGGGALLFLGKGKTPRRFI